MRMTLSFVLFPLVTLGATVPELPPSEYADTEVSTVNVQRQATFGEETFKEGTFTAVTMPDSLAGDGQLVIGTFGLKLFVR